MKKLFFTTLWFTSLLVSSMIIPVYSQTQITLSENKAIIRKPHFYIREIIDARSNKEFVGIVQRGLNNKLEPAHFTAGFQEELKNCVEYYLQPKPKLTPLILRVLKLHVFERTLPTSETAVAELVVEFYRQIDEGVVLVTSAGSTTTKFGIDVTFSHGRNISLSIEDCLNQVNTVLREKGQLATERAAVVEYKNLFATPDILEKHRYPILHDKPLKKGVYQNFIEFRNNEPGITDYSFNEIFSPATGAYGTPGGTIETHGKVLKNVWGYCDGEQIFIKVGQEFFAVSEEDGILWFEGYDISDVKTSFNNLGKSLVTGAFTGFFFYDIRLTWKTKRVKYVINLGNGDLFPLN